jgi:hypothetical protein
MVFKKNDFIQIGQKNTYKWPTRSEESSATEMTASPVEKSMLVDRISLPSVSGLKIRMPWVSPYTNRHF